MKDCGLLSRMKCPHCGGVIPYRKMAHVLSITSFKCHECKTRIFISTPQDNYRVLKLSGFLAGFFIGHFIAEKNIVYACLGLFLVIAMSLSSLYVYPISSFKRSDIIYDFNFWSYPKTHWKNLLGWMAFVVVFIFVFKFIW